MIITKELLDNLSAEARGNERLRKNFDLRNSEGDQSQRMLNVLEPGTEIPIHRHMDSSEIVTIVRGSICEKFYDKKGELIDEITLRFGEGIPMLIVPKGMWHNLECLESGTIIYESKDGAYQPTRPEDIMEKK